ncbi:hypothetical protein DV735_g2917, partial [Chaetothyriales sp. CBS 134920]
MGSTYKKVEFTTFYNVIDGKLVSTEHTRHGINPATGKPNPEVPIATKEDVDAALEAAKKAFPGWAATPIAERRKALVALADAVLAQKDEFIKLLIAEQGKPTFLANTELDGAINGLRKTAELELPELVREEETRILKVRYTPLGVAVGIVPWNFPIMLTVSKLAPAVLAGNTVLIKPSPFTPYTGLKVVELAQQFFPPGVVSVLSGDDGLGPLLTAHPIPQKISFTGSTFTGKKVAESAAKTLKRVTLELGGKDPAIILDDINIAEVAPKIAQSSFLNSGQLQQVCLAVKRIFVQESIIEPFRDALVAATKHLAVGPGTEPGVFLGPVQNSLQYEKVKTFFDEAHKEKQTIAVGGVNPTGDGYFITPTIIDRPAENSKLAREEPFGPIVPLLSFKTEEEAIAKANNTSYGLGASVWSSNVERANKIAERLEAGSVWVNSHLNLDPTLPFGGHKESGIGIEGGVGGLISYTNSQTLYLQKA